MRNYFLLLISTFLVSVSCISQETIDGTFEVNNTNKKYSLYIPSGYDANTPHQLMLGLHPLNVNRWDGESWRDTLVNFSEANDLILVCPDGGPDGRIDDAIDTIFTSMLLDSVANWYNINQDEKYIMGFSWGGRTTYTYGLRRTEEFAGYIAIGAAIDGVAPISDVIANAENENFYLVHGGADAAAIRFTPLLNGLKDNNACVESRLLSGIGHTIDFPNRNEVLGVAFEWIKNNNCNGISAANEITNHQDLILAPNPSNGDFKIQNLHKLNFSSIDIFDISGRKIDFVQSNNSIQIGPSSKGLFLLVLTSKNGILYKQKLLVY